MTLPTGTRLGPYEVLSPIGAGGMGEVYRAKDLQLDRVVAIKVLPQEVATDHARLRRFAQEARAASALNHPNIVTVYGVGESESVPYIAIEFVIGKTLIDLHPPLSPKKVLEIGAQIAEGLAAAHEAGIVHRDLKPANVMVTKEGLVKILDFGLAKQQTPSAATGSTVTTETSPKTLPGEIMGTAGYMSPEQASGKPVDFRSDQFSLGSVLYELATGQRAFRGGTAIDTLWAIMNQEPEPIARVQPAVPPPLRWTIERCLAKAPAERYQSTRDLARELTSLRDHLSEVTGPSFERGAAEAPKRLTRRRQLGLAAVGLLMVVGALLLFRARPVKTGTSVRFTLSPPPNTTFNFSTSSPAPPALSPDGRLLVFGARDSSGKDLLWTRSLDSLEARVLPGTDGATYPFWSPDSASIGYFAHGKLMKIGVDGGPPQTLCSAPEGRGGSWGSQGVIVFAPDPRSPIARVPVAGGDAVPVTHLPPGKPNVLHRWPSFLPDGKHFLYFVHDPDAATRAQGIWVGSLDSTRTAMLLPVASNVAYSPPGYLVFVREGALFAAPFDAEALRVTGEPISLARDVRYQPYRWQGVFSVSQTGLLAYQTGPAVETSQLVWFDRSGRQIDKLGAPADYEGIRLSPDGSRCAIEIRDPRTGTIDVWIADISRGITTRLTKGDSINDSPVWSPDGERIIFSSNRTGHFDLYEISSRGGRPEEAILKSEDGKASTDWSSDGHDLAFHKSGPTTGYKWQVWKLSVRDGAQSPLTQQVPNQTSARFSPNGAWVAYCSDESGNQEVYVQAVAGGDKRQISRSGGCPVAWRRDGKELFYLAPDNRLMAVPVTDGATLAVGQPQALFATRTRDSASDIPVFDASADGQRFLLNSRADGEPDPPLTVVVNWASGRKP